ncbi:GntR family transcriptional regulator, transcriptional repressor for pyruvate dehydrogenase complex [Nocardioides alpinus]|uniref:GntR family transcriptional regulator, transcriptional repressor for pyruvate dehydrogenase complex n=2 Tax=Nocardioides alpinus TaxID=748909 RepID=A0A1I0ZLI1_9ACTN|nr:GntR family transcriptional regulator, transcriptional repressor for pyruvate dehydrogenase complex [Nocardioides alpinus]
MGVVTHKLVRMSAQPHEHLTDAVLRPVRGHHAFEGCVEQLATAIRLGVYPVGSLLPPERELAERLAVSRATLREAIAALRQAGLIETKRGRGGGSTVTSQARGRFRGGLSRVSSATKTEWLDALEFRRVVEPGAAHLAASHDLSAPDRERLTATEVAVHDASGKRGHRQADSRLHLTIASLSGSARLQEAVTSVQSTLDSMLGAIPALEPNIGHSHRQHRQICTAILNGRPDRARKVMEDHCDDTAALLRGLLV